jgi:two-component system cell cycle sensor histidine kinase/response regulator CckA
MRRVWERLVGPLIATNSLASAGILALAAFNIATLASMAIRDPDLESSTAVIAGLMVVVVAALSILHIHHRHARARVREVELREAEERLREAQRLESIGRMAAGVGHDFNNLLMVVRGNAEILQYEHGSSTEVSEILHAVESGEALANRLLTAGRQARLRPEVVDVNAIAQTAAEMIRRLVSNHIEVHLELESEPWPARLDRHQVEQALLNLATNARDAMPDGGRLILRTHNRGLAREDLLGESQARPGEWVSIEVADTGHGMTDEVRRRVFEPFFTTKPRGKGTGLGLAMVHGTVAQCDGWVRVRSVVGIGTRVELLFPRA